MPCIGEHTWHPSKIAQECEARLAYMTLEHRWRLETRDRLSFASFRGCIPRRPQEVRAQFGCGQQQCEVRLKSQLSRQHLSCALRDAPTESFPHPFGSAPIEQFAGGGGGGAGGPGAVPQVAVMPRCFHMPGHGSAFGDESGWPFTVHPLLHSTVQLDLPTQAVVSSCRRSAPHLPPANPCSQSPETAPYVALEIDAIKCPGQLSVTAVPCGSRPHVTEWSATGDKGAGSWEYSI
jgi:hypothetical protein